jgi:hypothetical protein
VNGRLNLAMTPGSAVTNEEINDYEDESQTPEEEPKDQRECRRLPMRRVLFLRTWTLQLRGVRVQITGARLGREAASAESPGGFNL